MVDEVDTALGKVCEKLNHHQIDALKYVVRKKEEHSPFTRRVISCNTLSTITFFSVSFFKTALVFR